MMKKKFLIVFLSALIVIITPAIASATDKTRDEALAWAQSQVGKALDYDGAYGAQCVDLIKYYYAYLGVTPVLGNGCDYATNALPDGWQRLQGAAPEPGDILVYSGSDSNPAGHVAIYESDYSHYNQNVSGKQWVVKCTWHYAAYEPYWGVIRPNFVGAETPSQVNWPDVVAGTANTNTVISWSTATNATDYDVYIYKQGDSSYYHFGNTTSTSYSVILPAATYEVEVVACNKSNGTNVYAGNAHRTTFTVTEAVPSQINWPDVVAGTSETNTVISWSAATNATDYDVYIYVQGSASYYHFGNTTSTSYSVILPAATYEVEVVACNKSNGTNVYAGNAHRTTFTVTNATTSPTATPVPTSTPKPTEKPNAPVSDGAVVAISSATASAGNTVNVTIDLSDNKGFANLGIQVGYDANALMLTSVTNNSTVGATYTPAQSITANPYNMGWDSTDNITYNGNLATMTFTIKENAAEGIYPITVSYYTGIKGDYTDGEDVNYDADFNSLGLNYVNGTITVSSHIAGDINGDGKVNNQDGTFLLRHLAGWNVNIDESALDVNGDGRVNNQDGTVLLRYLAGWSVTIH